MRQEIASEMLESTLKFSTQLNDIIAKLRDEADPEEFQKIRSSIGEVLFVLLTEIINPIVKKFPELRPEQLEPPP